MMATFSMMDGQKGTVIGRSCYPMRQPRYTPMSDKANSTGWPFTQFSKGYVQNMGLIVVLLVIALILAGVGFAVHILWILAVVFFVAWLVGLVLGTGRKSKT